MPYRKKYARKKRGYRKKRSYALTKISGAGLSAASPLGKSFKAKTRYVETRIEINGGIGGTPATHVFSMNGLYDPDITGSGHQPIGFDEMMLMYDHYCVIGARARVTFSNNDTTNSQIVILQLKDEATLSSNTSEMIENGMSRWTELGPRGSSKDTRTLSINCSPSRFFGRKVLQGDKYQGDNGSNPSDQVYLHITVEPSVSADLGAVRGTVELEYIVVYTEPKQLAQS